MAQQIQLRHDTAANWTTVNPTLMVGEFGYETDTHKFKIGDGSTAWSSLAYSILSPTPITGGGTGQTTASTAFGALSPLTTKADLLTYGTSNTRLPVGSDTQVLTADSTQTLGMKWAAVASAPTGPSEAVNLGLLASVLSNALTVALKQGDGGTDPGAGASAVKIAFRSATASTGAYNERSVTGALSVVAASGASLGLVSGQSQFIYVYALDNAGTVELALSGSRIFDEGSLQNTTAISASSTSNATLYSTTARTGVPVRLLGRMKVNESTAGTYASAPSEIALASSPFTRAVRSQYSINGWAGYGSTNTSVLYTSNSPSVNTGSAITRTASTVNGDSFTINEDGLYTLSGGFRIVNAGNYIGLSRNASGTQLTLGPSSFGVSNSGDLGHIAFGTTVASAPGTCDWTGFLRAGDVIRVHMDTGQTLTAGSCWFAITKIGD